MKTSTKTTVLGALAAVLALGSIGTAEARSFHHHHRHFGHHGYKHHGFYGYGHDDNLKCGYWKHGRFWACKSGY